MVNENEDDFKTEIDFSEYFKEQIDDALEKKDKKRFEELADISKHASENPLKGIEIFTYFHREAVMEVRKHIGERIKKISYNPSIPPFSGMNVKLDLKGLEVLLMEVIFFENTKEIMPGHFVEQLGPKAYLINAGYDDTVDYYALILKSNDKLFYLTSIGIGLDKK